LSIYNPLDYTAFYANGRRAPRIQEAGTEFTQC
jgi:hypothetical protein